MMDTFTGKRPVFRTVPKGVTELAIEVVDSADFISVDGGIVELKDGTLMLAQGAGVLDSVQDHPNCRISKDGGKTWSDSTPLNCDIGAGGLIRLQSGKLAIYGCKPGGSKDECYCSTSSDEGKTWTPGAPIGNIQGWHPFYHSMIQLSSGRLLLAGYWEALDCHADDMQRVTMSNWGWWRGVQLWCEGHRAAEMGICVTYYSDDEGKTWTQCKGGMFGWFDEYGDVNGNLGITDVYEPTVAETKDGRLLMLSRCKRGRLVQCYSLNGGESWLSMQPAELASSQSPAMLVNIPGTDDLLCIWNQVSIEESRRSLCRGRLSSAISRDSGWSWGNFKTLELCEGLADVDRVPPDSPIPAIVRGRAHAGQLPDGLAVFDYPNVDIIGDKVFVRYHRSWPKMRNADQKDQAHIDTMMADKSTWPQYEDRKAQISVWEVVLRIYPLEWFYC